MENVLSNPNGLLTAAKKYLQNNIQVVQRRKEWEETIKTKIEDVLKLVQKTADIGLRIQPVFAIKNQGYVKLSFPKEPSGISDFSANGSARHYVKFGGELTFYQMTNGKILVYIDYPTIEAFRVDKKQEVLSTHEPAEITEEIIVQHAVTFIDRMAEWENSNN